MSRPVPGQDINPDDPDFSFHYPSGIGFAVHSSIVEDGVALQPVILMGLPCEGCELHTHAFVLSMEALQELIAMVTSYLEGKPNP